MSAFLELDGVTRAFGGLQVLNGVSLTVPRGGIFGLIGPNGAGKTTLFNLMTGVLAPDDGSIWFNGQAIAGLAPHRICALGISRTFQNIRLFRDMTLAENVLVGMHGRLSYGLGGALSRSPRFRQEEEKGRQRAHELLGWVGLGSAASELAGSLSYGGQRKLELARALASEPQLLLLDEPVAGMNTAEKAELMTEIRQIAGRGYTILLIDHDMKFVMGLCSQVSVLNFGKVIASGPPAGIVADPAVIEAYLGREDDEAPVEADA